MSHMGDLLIRKTEAVLSELNAGDLSDDEFDKLWDSVHEFIMNGGDLIYDSASVIADEYKKKVSAGELKEAKVK